MSEVRPYIEQWWVDYWALVERCLITALEAELGRVPRNDEMMFCCHCLIHVDGARDYQWKGEHFLSIPAFPVGCVLPRPEDVVIAESDE